MVGVLAAELHVPLHGHAILEHVDPASAGVLEPGAAGHHHGLHVLAQLQAHLQALATPDAVRSLAGEEQVGLELAVADLGVDLGHRQLMLAASEGEGARKPLPDPRHVVFTDAGAHLVGVEHIDLGDADALRDRLPDLRPQSAELPIDGRPHGEVLQAAPQEGEVVIDQFQAGIDLPFLTSTEQRIVADVGLQQVAAFQRQLVLLPAPLVLLRRHQVALLQALVQAVGALQLLQVVLQLQQLLLPGVGLLVHGKPRGAQVVLLVQQLRLAVDGVHLELLVGQAQDGFARLDGMAVLQEDLLDHPALHGVQEHGADGLHGAGDRDVLAELTLDHDTRSHPVAGHPHPVTAQGHAGQQQDQDDGDAGAQPKQAPSAACGSRIERPVHAAEIGGPAWSRYTFRDGPWPG